MTVAKNDAPAETTDTQHVPNLSPHNGNPFLVSSDDFAQAMQQMFPKESELVVLRIQNMRAQAIINGTPTED